MQQRQRVTVVGAGVIGLSIAWELAARGAQVTVVEAEQPGAGTSGTSFAWANASSKIGYRESYFTLNRLSLTAHHARSVQAGADVWLHATGEIEIADDADGLYAKVQALHARGYDAELLTSDRLNALEPGTVLLPHSAAAYYAQEGWVDVAAFLRALMRRCTEAGVRFLMGDPARDVLREGAGVTGLRLTSGDTLGADVVVTALGRWTSAFAATLQVPIPLVAPETLGSKAVGLLATVLPRQAPERLLHSGAINWSPLADGRALLASDAGDATVALDRSPEAAREAARSLVLRAAALNPIFEGASVEHATIGLRALPIDGEAICGWAPGVGGLYVVATHSGVTLAPLLGQCVAREIVEGTADPLLNDFRPDRFWVSAPVTPR